MVIKGLYFTFYFQMCSESKRLTKHNEIQLGLVKRKKKTIDLLPDADKNREILKVT